MSLRNQRPRIQKKPLGKPFHLWPDCLTSLLFFLASSAFGHRQRNTSLILFPYSRCLAAFHRQKILCKLKKRKLRKTRCPDNKRLRFLDNKGHQSISHITHVTENGAKFWYVLKAGLYSSLKLESPNRLGF